jgi:threonine aldolase
MRFISAPWIGMLESGAWLRNAERANSMACLLADEISTIKDVSLMFPRQANAVFLTMPEAATTALRDSGWRFYSFIGAGGARFMCSWQTTEEDVQSLAKAIREVSAS